MSERKPGAIERARGRDGRLAIVLALGLVLAACSEGEQVQFRKANAAAKRGGKLVVGIGQPRSIDPPATDATDPSGQLVVGAMCDRLIELDPVTGNPSPAIAESWQISDGGERLTVKLRKGVRFHNGKEVVAEDVVYALSRVADRDFAGPSASIFEPVAGFEQVHGNEEIEDERFRKQFAGMQVIENYSFEVRLVRDQADFFRALAHPAAVPLPKAQLISSPASFATRPTCTGPYQLAEPWTPAKKSITLKRFPGYYGKNLAYTAGGAGYPDTIEFRIYPSLDAQRKAFQRGEVDVTQVEALAGASGRFGDDLVKAVTPSLEYIGLPTKTPPFNVRAMRLALSLALNRREIVESVYGGTRTPASSFLPPAMGAIHRPRACLDNAPAAGAPVQVDSVGVDLKSFNPKLYFNDEFDHRKLMQAVAAQWKKVFGFNVTLVPMKWDQYLEMGSKQPGFDGPFRMTWTPEYPAADRYLYPLFHSTGIGQNNFSGFSDRRLDRALEKVARRAVAEEDQKDEYQAIEDIVCGEMPIIPLAYGGRVYLVQKASVGSAINRFWSQGSGLVTLRELYVK